jgi:hypothetical protein
MLKTISFGVISARVPLVMARALTIVVPKFIIVCVCNIKLSLSSTFSDPALKISALF